MKPSAFLTLGLMSLICLLTFQMPAMAQTNSSFNRQKLGTYLDTLRKNNKTMGSVAIDSAGKEVYHHSIGFIRKKDGQPVAANEQSEYRIGSVSKIFTAAVIFQLIEEGKLSLSTKLAAYYPHIPKADSITIGQMLHHRSGLFNITDDSTYTSWMTKKQSEKQMLDRFRDHQPQFPPGSKTSYSNTNYILLGYIIEKITGDSYAVQLKKRIIKPLGLQHTYYGGRIDPDKDEAFSYRYTGSAWKKLPETDMSIPGGAGGIVSTPIDLTHFIRALFKGQLVSHKSLQHMKNIEHGLGMGLMKIPFYNLSSYGHTGGIDGFQSMLLYFPQGDVAVAFTGNGLNYSMNDVLIGVLSIYFGRDFDIPSFSHTTISLNADEMQSYTGTYGNAQATVEIKIFVKDSTLRAQASGQVSFPLTASDKTTMRFERAGIVIKFHSLKNNKYQQFTIIQHGTSEVFKRQ